jgi:dihydrofolate synthase/folylpolyglutamate synthase
VLSAIDILRDMGYNVSCESIRRGLNSVKWPARFEIISHDPLVIADGGHNPEGIDGAVDSIKTYFGDKKVTVITGVMADKDHGYMSSRIAEMADTVYCIKPQNPRALDADKLAAEFSSRGVSACACESVDEACRRALEHARGQACPIVSLGSLYMYSEVVEAFKGLK